MVYKDEVSGERCWKCAMVVLTRWERERQREEGGVELDITSFD